jgi:aminoglycoside phosphotransferase (APT) family kinase protein
VSTPGSDGAAASGGAAAGDPVDLARLRDYLAGQLPGGAREVTVSGFAASGSSNITAFLEVDGQRWVLRRPPVGDLLPTSHDMIREYRFVRALAGSAVPVPPTVLACTDVGVLGAPFYIAGRVDGAVLQDQIPAGYADPDQVTILSHHVIDTLAALHQIHWQPLDLPYRPGDYLQRQISRWTRQAELTPTAARLEGLPAITSWIQARCPAQAEQVIVHGDYGLHNMIIGIPPQTRINAVLDWEMATIGDPLADLAWFLSGWGRSQADGGVKNPGNVITTWDGAPRAADLLDRYERASGRTVGDWTFYEAFTMWKGAIITEGLYSQFVGGTAANPAVIRFREEVPAQVAQLRQLIGL